MTGIPGETSGGRRVPERGIVDVRKAEQELLRLNRTLRALSDSDKALVRATDEKSLLQETCRIVVEECGHALVWIGYAEEDEGKSVRPVAHAGFDQDYIDAMQVTWADNERGRGPTGTAIRTRKPDMCRDMRTDPRFAPWREEALKRGFASCVVFPLIAGERAFGAISIYSTEPDRFLDEESGLLSELAGDLAFGVTAIRLRAAKAAADESVRQSEERYRSLFENMLDGVAFCQMVLEEGRPPDFRYLAVNRAFGELTGLKDVVGRMVSEVIPGVQDAHPELFETYGRVAFTGRPERFKIHFEPLDAWFSISVYSGEKGYFTAVFENITEGTRAEERLRELNETLEARVAERTVEAESRTDQLRALASELSQTEWRERQRLAGVLHDHLQQILVGAKFNLEALKGSIREKDAQKVAGRVDELLDQSIRECRSLTMILSPPVLQEAGLAGGLAWLSRRMQEQHGLQIDLAVDDDFLEPANGGVKFFLFDAVRELLFNVVKHSGVRFARVFLGRKSGQVEIRVEDHGKGLDPGYPRDRGEESAGFGLFSIRHRLELIGGIAVVESAPGKGTTVTLRVPTGAAPAKAEPVAPAPSDETARKGGETQANPAPSGRIRVVFADDHKIFREGLLSLLGTEGSIDVVGEAADGMEAVDLARALKPDVVIMDVTMPRMNGIEATRQITAEMPGVHVIGLSMHQDESIAASMREAGAVDFVTKGGPSESLISAIRAAASGGGGQ